MASGGMFFADEIFAEERPHHFSSDFTENFSFTGLHEEV